MTDTIYALSSGRPPAAIAILRISGPHARHACDTLAGGVPEARRATLRRLRDSSGRTLDHALTLFFPGPATATGEDLLELHLHGGRAVVTAVETALAELPGLRMAEPGEFTRRALEHGRIDLTQAEGLADLLEAETEAQRRSALAASEGVLSRAVQGWMDRLSLIAARIEAELDFGDEGDVQDAVPFDPRAGMLDIACEINDALAAPSVERLRDGPLVVISGPPNAGKSSLFNAMLRREAAIVTPIAGTTRDLLEASVTHSGMAYRLVDTAGLANKTEDPIEKMGIERAEALVRQADVVIWMGEPDMAPAGAVTLSSKVDCQPATDGTDLAVSCFIESSIDQLWTIIHHRCDHDYIRPDHVALRRRERALLQRTREHLSSYDHDDPLINAESVRLANRALGELLGVDATEAMMNALFGRFCLGK